MTLKALLLRKFIDYEYATFTEFAESIGLTCAEVTRYISGEYVCPRQKNRRKICEALDIAPEVLDAAIRESMFGGR